jgi:hypothetical protein
MRPKTVDLLNAFLSAAGPTTLRAAATAVDPGGQFHGWERHKATQVQVGFGQQIPGVFGAKVLSFGAEFIYKAVPDLPDPSVIRFGRADVFGQGPVIGAPPPTAAISNTFDGFVSKEATAYHLRVGLLYANVAPGLDLQPSFFWGQDLSGWSSDGSIVEDRKLATLSLKATFAKRWFAEVAWQPTWGGAYNNLRDRSTAQMNLGYTF